MRRREDELIDPEIAEQLDAIDATLAGDPVAPRFAELAELALLLAAGRPEPARPEFAAELDRRVASRFGRGEAGGSGGRTAAASDGRAVALSRGGRWHRWGLGPMLGTGATALAAVIVGVMLVTSGGGGTGVRNHVISFASGQGQARLRATTTPRTSAGAAAGTSTTSSTSSSVHARPGAPVLGPVATAPADGSGTHGVAPPLNFGTGNTKKAPPSGSASGASGSAATGSTGTGSASGSGGSSGAASVPTSPAPIPNGRKIIQSSNLQLGAPAKRIDAVAQEVFTVVSSVNGIVDSSNVASTGGPGASAQFSLRVPSALLQQALTDLSRLRFANVISRIDATQDVNGSFVSAQRRIALAQAALIRLRAKLAATTIQTEIASLHVQIAGEQATIAQAQRSLRSLNRQVDYTRVQVSVLATAAGSASGGANGGFGLHRAGHDALRVLEVTAGVALIVLAALVPLALLAAFAWWLALALQRRRRERALDLA